MSIFSFCFFFLKHCACIVSHLPGRDEDGLDEGLPDEGLEGSKLKLLLDPLIPPRPPLFLLPFSFLGGATGCCCFFFLSPSPPPPPLLSVAELRFSELWLTMGNT